MVFKDMDQVIPDHVMLSKAHENDLTDTADTVVAETLHSYEKFIANDRQFNSRLWKHVKTREKVHVYRTRRSDSKKLRNLEQQQPSRPRLLSNDTIEQQQREAQVAGRPHAYTPYDENDGAAQYQEDKSICPVFSPQTLLSHSSSSDCGSFSVFPEESVLEKVKPPHVPLVAAIGCIDGSVEDVAFGGLAHTTESWHERNSYVKNDGFDGRKVLATFQEPSQEDPFRFVGIKWATSDNIAAFASRRDVVFLESSGIALDWDGERVYYSLAHSIELDECPALPEQYHVIRMNLSICYIMRQIARSQIEVYARGYADMGGNLPAVIGTTVFSHGVVGVVSIVESSYLKKLAWQIAHARTTEASTDQETNCGVCGKRVVKFGKRLLRKGGACAICRQLTCPKCSVQKKLLLDVTKDLQDQQLTFCVSCVIVARQVSAWDIASQQLQLRR